ncbi:MAG TPA: MaoC family dehydratase [Candidatus Saccharimonadales bacterium]|nr:MaoC family dehydratase [Candidatus Saccharimonadales bacterium]
MRLEEQKTPLYFEDLHVGQRFTSGTFQMDETAIKLFASQFDPQPIHIDEAAAREGMFQGIIASGWHTASVAMRLLTTGGLPFANNMVGLSCNLAWPRPTRPGDILQVESEIQEIARSSNSKRGIVTVRSTMSNQRGETVYILTAKIMVSKRAIRDSKPERASAVDEP